MPETRATTLHLPTPVSEVVATAMGRAEREDPVLPETGGPAGNARLTAWIGLVLLVLSVAELLTLVNVRGLISWHVAIGALLGPPALAKTASTGWRLVRYYTGNPAYRQAGPPPLVLRLLGPLVVLSTLGLLGSGVVLVLLGESSSQTQLVSLLGFHVTWVTVHQASFAVWAVVTGAHVLARLVPALRLSVPSRANSVPGTARRALVLVAAAVVAIIAAVVLVRADGSWSGSGDHEQFRGAPLSSGSLDGGVSSSLSRAGVSTEGVHRGEPVLAP
jgi:hypothetical protein